MAQARGVPLSKVFQALSVVTRTPVNAVWAMAALAFLLGMPLLYSSTVFSAIASISSLGLYVSCKSLPLRENAMIMFKLPTSPKMVLPLLRFSAILTPMHCQLSRPLYQL